MTAAEYRAAQDRYDRVIELREARNALAEAEKLIGASRDELAVTHA